MVAPAAMRGAISCLRVSYVLFVVGTTRMRYGMLKKQGFAQKERSYD